MKITIDTKAWETQAAQVKRKKISKQLLNNRVKSGAVDSWYIKQLGLTLVKR